MLDVSLKMHFMQLEPKYLCDVVEEKTVGRSLKSQEKSLLKEPMTNLVTAGDSAFAKAGTKLWNAPATNLDVFNARLKTH